MSGERGRMVGLMLTLVLCLASGRCCGLARVKIFDDHKNCNNAASEGSAQQ